jgi:origin recognition complex subunit 1
MSKALIGRENEYSMLKTKIEEAIKGNTPLSLYISGTPGTGKTATTKSVLKSFDESKKVISVYINCVGTNKKADIQKAILAELVATLPSKISLYDDELDNLFTKSKKTIIICFDEIDHLRSSRNSLLYEAFGWPTKFKHVIVIGIANALDLTKRNLPNLQFKGHEPEVLTFQPYNTKQIEQILKNHVSTFGGNISGEEEKALLMCAKKAANQKGDIRNALNVISQAFQEQEEEENKDLIPQQPMGLSTPKKNSARAVNRIFNEIHASPLVRSTLPLHSSIFLATLIRLVGNTKTSSTTKLRLYNAYETVCKNLNYTPVIGDERIEAINILESMSVIRCSGQNLKTNITFIDEIAKARAKIADSNLVAAVDEMNL